MAKRGKRKAKRAAGDIVLAIPDLHCPFEHPDALRFLKAVEKAFKPTKIVCLGDEIDGHALSRFPHDPDGYSPGHELSKAIEHLIPFYLAFPEVMVCESNHTVRGHKLAFQAKLPAAFLKHISVVLNAPDGWEWRDRWEIDGVIYKHGTGKTGENAHKNHAKAAGRSVVIGHIHAHGGVAYLAPGWFAVNASCLIQQDAYCFAYAKEMEPNIQLGCAIVNRGKSAHFIPMLVDAEGRWIGSF